jgi:ricin-type beta-trefoil lectin protein
MMGKEITVSSCLRRSFRWRTIGRPVGVAALAAAVVAGTVLLTADRGTGTVPVDLAAAKQAVVPNSTVMLTNPNSRLVLDVTGTSIKDGVLLHLLHPYGGKSQRWTLKPDGGAFRLVNANSNSCADIKGPSKASGAIVHQWHCYNSDSQRWYLDQLPQGDFQIRSKFSGRCLDVINGGTREGTGIQQADCNRGASQRWNLRGGTAPLPQDCAVRLNCTIADFDKMSMPERLTFVRALESGPAQQFERGFIRWRAIEGVMELFEDKNMGAPGSWVSITDGGILEGIEQGLAIALGKGGSTTNKGAALWATYLKDLKAGRLSDKATHNQAWGVAEQTSTDHGVAEANRMGVHPSKVEGTWFQFTQMFRFMLANERAISVALAVLGNPGLTRLYNWFTNTSDDAGARRGGGAALVVAKVVVSVQDAIDYLNQLQKACPACAA